MSHSYEEKCVELQRDLETARRKIEELERVNDRLQCNLEGEESEHWATRDERDEALEELADCRALLGQCLDIIADAAIKADPQTEAGFRLWKLYREVEEGT